MENIIKELQLAGLSDKEARIYLSLLSMGKGSAYAISEKSGLKKPTTYVILGELIKKGFVVRIPKVRKQLFTAISPHQFAAKVTERLNAVAKIVPALDSISRSPKGNIRTLYFEGYNGVREALLYRIKEMENTDIIGFYGALDKSSRGLLKLFVEFRERLSQHNVKVRGIVPDHPSLRKYRKEDKIHQVSMKMFPYREYSANASIEAGDTFVRIVTFPDIQATIIENPRLAKTVRQIFEIVWKKK